MKRIISYNLHNENLIPKQIGDGTSKEGSANMGIFRAKLESHSVFFTDWVCVYTGWWL